MNDEIMYCELITTEHTVTLGQLCRSCGVHAEWVTLLVEEGVLEPRIPEQQAAAAHRAWAFAANQLPRVHTALRLQRDLGLNIAGIALALELIEENHALKNRLDAFSNHLD